MKLLITLLTVLCIGSTYAQTQTQNNSNTRLFAQCMFSISSQAELDDLTFNFYSDHSEIEMVRFDLNTQRAFVITTGLDNLTAEDFSSWFGEYESTIQCVQIGVYGVDSIAPYPFTNCEN